MEIKVDLAKLRPLQQSQSREQVLSVEPVQITSLSDLAPYIDGLSDLNVNELEADERTKFFKELWEFGASLTRLLDTRQDYPTESEIIATAATRVMQEPDFFTSRYLPAGVVERITKEICDGRDRSRPIWKLSPSHEIVCSAYRDQLGDQFVQRISEIANQEHQNHAS
jgi:hypothetical protein